MDFEAYRKAYFADPAPEASYSFVAVGGATLFFRDFDQAIAYYTEVLGPPGYVEGDGTRGWMIGTSTLTILRGGSGAPANTEIPFAMQSAAEAERLQAAFVAAGGSGEPPADQLMYEPVRYCPVTDPFGTNLLIYARLDENRPSVNVRWNSP